MVLQRLNWCGGKTIINLVIRSTLYVSKGKHRNAFFPTVTNISLAQ